MIAGGRPARTVMVLGCTSGAGKSWLTTALCHWYAGQGLRVAPFKAQNMSNHARVIEDGDGTTAEIGSAQYFQALAAGTRPDVRMNPVLLKPESHMHSQVVLLGHVSEALSQRPWRQRSADLWNAAEAALASLRADFDVVVIEGAGSPAEINLADTDFVNTQTAISAEAACLLVADIDRGGAFAHLYGTHCLMDGRVRCQVRGFVLNRFRGDASLLSPGPERLRDLTGVPTLAVVPMLPDHGLPEEDQVPQVRGGTGGPHIVILAAPHASNLDEFEPLSSAGLRVTYATRLKELHNADWLVLPGSKQARADLAWMQVQGLDAAIRAHVAKGRPLLAICGGLQILGERLEDPAGREGGAPGEVAGLGLLPLQTRYGVSKYLACTHATFSPCTGPWSALSGLDMTGYEIHLGVTEMVGTPPPGTPRTRAVLVTDGKPIGWQCGSTLAIYAHGLFENPKVVSALFGVTPPDLHTGFGRMSSVVERSFGRDALMSLLNPQ